MTREAHTDEQRIHRIAREFGFEPLPTSDIRRERGDGNWWLAPCLPWPFTLPGTSAATTRVEAIAAAEAWLRASLSARRARVRAERGKRGSR